MRSLEQELAPGIELVIPAYAMYRHVHRYTHGFVKSARDIR